ncbi:MAG: hypothetical protein AAF959_12940 [Cyanobacteria bacterium P01_D01_bin.56]
MLKHNGRARIDSDYSLADVWALRYRPDFSPLEKSSWSIALGEIYEALFASGRKEISIKLSRPVIEEACKLSTARTVNLYVQFDQLNVQAINQLVILFSQLYLQLIETYQAYPPVPRVSEQELARLPLKELGNAFRLSKLTEVADTVEPFLHKVRLQSAVEDNWKTQSYLTAQVNFTNALLLSRLDPVEQTLVRPYLKFLEDQVVIPWLRLCNAAESRGEMSPQVSVVRRLLPKVSEISLEAHRRWQKQFPNYYSHRGGLSNVGVMHSSIRDFDMFQVYLWLSFLQGNFQAVEKELLVFSADVYGKIGIPWKMTKDGTKLLVATMLENLNAVEVPLVSKFMDDILYLVETYPVM